MDDLKQRRIDRAIECYRKARLLWEIRKIHRELIERPETFTAHLHRLRLPLPSKI